jgi:hypothetical protein
VRAWRFSACSVPAFGGYTGYRLFTINHTLTGTANSTNFTVLISGTYAEFATTGNGGNVQNTVSCGVNSITCPADLVFTSDAGCSSPLAGWEFESYTATTGQIVAWVIVPTLSVTTNTSDLCLRRQLRHHHFSGRLRRARPSIPIPRWFTIFRTEPR